MINLTHIFKLQAEVDNLILTKINEKRKEKHDNEEIKTRFGSLLKGEYKEWNKGDFDFFTFDQRKIAFNVELGELANELGFFKYWKFNHTINKERVKDEWADCLAFLISMIQSKNLEEYINDDLSVYNEESIMLGGGVEREFKGMMYNNLTCKQDYRRCLHELFWMMGSIDYTYKELIEAYEIKTKENIRRAKEGY